MDPTSTFNLTINRDLIVLGNAEGLEQIRRIIAPLNYIVLCEPKTLHAPRTAMHFIIAAVNFGDMGAMQEVVRVFEQSPPALAHRIVYAASPSDLKREHLLLAIELGCRHVSHGPSRDEDLRTYLKRVCKEAAEAGSIAGLEQEIEEAQQKRDQAQLQQLAEKLVASGRDSEESLRLLVLVNRHLKRPSREEFYLKKILSINPQNLWAANTLGRLYIREKRAAEGIEILQRLSQFHDLNSERLYELGHAYLHAGVHGEAEKTFARGEVLTEGHDDRFKEGLAKVKFATGDTAGALQVLGKAALSVDVISFLNMRAIMAIRAGKIEEGLRCYKQAADGSGDADKLLQAKLKFNYALGFIRANDAEKALDLFQQSVELGGTKFTRAQGPLAIAQKIVKSAKQKAALGASAPTDPTPLGSPEFDELDWEQID